jgi:hypothetical protein
VGLEGFPTALVPTTSGTVRPNWHVVTLDANGDVVDTLLVVRGAEEFVASDAVVIPLYGRRTGMGSNGTRIAVGTGDSLAVSVRDLRSKRWASFSSSVLNLQLTATTLEAERAARSRFASGRVRSLIDALPAPPTRPAYSDVVVAESGQVWLGKYLGVHERDMQQTWQVFSADGTLLGDVPVPVRFTLMDVSRGLATGVWRDELDREVVRAYEILSEMPR